MVSAAALPVPTPEPIRVLIVEDDQLTRSLMPKAIRSPELKFRAAGSVEAARALYRWSSVIVTDWKMEPLSGTDLVHEIRAAGLSTPVVLISGSEPPPAERALFFRYLSKPFDVAILRTILLDAGRRQRATCPA